jgi:hypothetical protein
MGSIKEGLVSVSMSIYVHVPHSSCCVQAVLLRELGDVHMAVEYVEVCHIPLALYDIWWCIDRHSLRAFMLLRRRMMLHYGKMS